jgi:Uma2 family endonuclease
MVGQLVPSTWTVDDLELLPEGEGVRHEILEGELVMSAAPVTEHQRIAGRLFVILYRALVESGHAEVFSAPFDVELSRSSCVEPDLVVIRAEHADRITAKRLVGAPDLAIEILSPGTASRDLVTKLKLYARHGIPCYWVVDPDRRELVEYLLEGEAYRLSCTVGEEECFTPRGFPELSIPLRALFNPPAPR